MKQRGRPPDASDHPARAQVAAAYLAIVERRGDRVGVFANMLALTAGAQGIEIAAAERDPQMWERAARAALGIIEEFEG